MRDVSSETPDVTTKCTYYDLTFITHHYDITHYYDYICIITMYACVYDYDVCIYL